MSRSLLSLFARDTAPDGDAPILNVSRPALLEPLEDRRMFSVAAPLAAPLTGPAKIQTAVFANKIAKNGVTSVVPMTISSVQVVNGQLMALGSVAGQAFAAPITTEVDPNVTAT